MAEEVAEEEVVKAIDLLRDLKSKASELSSHVTSLTQKVEDEEISTSKGVSFLEVKYQLLLSYLVNLTHVMNIKLRGKSLVPDKSVDRLVEIRTVLEKIRPIEQKLKYQIDKLIKTATTGTLGEADPLRFKANPGGLESKLDLEDDDESSSAEEDEKPAESVNVYRPPKLAAMYYEGDETQKSRTERLLEKRKKRALSSHMMQELREEVGDMPMEIKDSSDLHRAKEDKAGKEREEYEEKYFVRMSLTKKERNAAKRLRTVRGLDDITRFGDTGALTGNLDDEGEDYPKKKKQKLQGKGKRKGKKGKKRRM